jgi:hypothetical protein
MSLARWRLLGERLLRAVGFKVSDIVAISDMACIITFDFNKASGATFWQRGV